MKKIIVYFKDKPGNNIKSIIERRNPILNLKDDEDYIVVDSSVRVDIRKDKIVDGILCKYKEESERTNNYDSSNIKYKNLIGLIFSHEKECGITNYSNDLVKNSPNNFIKFVNRESEVEASDDTIKCWSLHDKDYNELFERIVESGVEVVHFQYNHGIMNPGALKHLGKRLARADIFSIITLHSVAGGVSVFKDYFDLIVVHSESCKRELMLEKVPEEKIRIVNIGSFKYESSDNVLELKQSLGFNPEDILIFNFGFLMPHKGVDILIDAFNDLQYDFENAKLVVLGSVDNIQHRKDSQEYLTKLIKQVNKYGIGNKVTFIPEFLETETIQRYLSCANVIALPYKHSASQGASSTLRTVLSVCKPTVVSDIPLFDDLKGILKFCKANNKISLKKSIYDILDKPQSNIENKIDAFIKKTSWKKVGLQHAHIYRAFNDLKIHIDGQLFSYQSTSQINRGLGETLDQLGVDVSMKSVNMAENPNYVFKENFAHLLGENNKKDICVKNYYPVDFKYDDSKVKINFLPAETTSINPNWVEGINNNLDIVWTYSSHGKQVMKNSGVKKPIVTVPPGYDPNMFKPDGDRIDFNKYVDSYTKKKVFPPIDDDTFKFMFVGAAQKRKGIDVLLKAMYSGKFTVDDNVLFIIKSYSTGEVHKEILKAQEDSTLDKDRFPRLIYIYEDSLPQDLVKLYRTVDLLVFPTRAECWAWSVLEAMACGTPALVTRFGGHLDYADDSTSYLLDYELVKSTYHEQGNEAYWAEVDSENLANSMYDIYKKGINDANYIDKVKNGLVKSIDWTWDECALKVVRFLQGLKHE